MRRLLITLTLLFLCTAAHAQTYPYPEDTILSAFALTPVQQELAEALYFPLFCGEKEIILPRNTRYEDVPPVMSSLSQDHPELFNVGLRYTVTYYGRTPDYAASIIPDYRVSAEEAAALRSELYLRAYLLVSRQQSAITLHDELCRAVVYGGDPELRHTAVGALLQGAATCEGYAQALTLLYRMAGIPCGIITGTATASDGSSDRHAWNFADIGGLTLIDATWNDQDRAGLNTHWYFGLSDEQMASSHTPDDKLQVPECGDHANWHALNSRLVNTSSQLDAAIGQFTQSGEPMNLRFTDEDLYFWFSRNVDSYLEDYSRRQPQSSVEGMYSYIHSDDQQCLILFRPQ